MYKKPTTPTTIRIAIYTITLAVLLLQGSINSTIVLARENKKPMGNFDVADCKSLRGWAYDPDKPSQTIDVAVYIDGPTKQGKLMGTYTTYSQRSDVNQILNIEGTHGFDIPIPDSVGRNVVHQFYIYAVDTTGESLQLLSNAPRKLSCTQSPIGWVSVTCKQVSGWAYDPDTPNDPVEIVVYGDGPLGVGELIVAKPTDINRTDVIGSIKPITDPNATPGFEHNIQNWIKTKKAYSNVVYVYAVDNQDKTKQLLGNSGKVLICHSPLNTRQFQLTDDPNMGHVTIENSTFKAVFHYRFIPQEYFSRGGGNLYKIYYKPTDPYLETNLVAVAPFGSAEFRALGVGAGGVGNTEMYALPGRPLADSSGLESGFISDNVPDAEYISHDIEETDGKLRLTFRYRVGDRKRNLEWYDIEKVWEITGQGTFFLTHNWKLLRSGWLSEVATRSQWSYDAGWNKMAKWGHNWSFPAEVEPDCHIGLQSNGNTCPFNRWIHINLTELNPDDTNQDGVKAAFSNCWNDKNTFHPQKVILHGSQTAPHIIIEPYNIGEKGDNYGFDGSGLWKLNRIVSNQKDTDSMFEQCTYDLREEGGYASHGTGFFSWWGGAVAVRDRYKNVDLNQFPTAQTWQDRYKISLATDNIGTPFISPVPTQQCANFYGQDCSQPSTLPAILSFRRLWALGNSGADKNSDGKTNTLDYLAVLREWLSP